MNRAMVFLMRKRIWRFRFVYLVLAGLVATVMIAVLLFHGYLMALTGEFAGKLVYPTLPDAFLARAPVGQSTPLVNSANIQLQLYLWPVQAPMGEVEMAEVTTTRLPDWPSPAPGEVWLPLSQQGRLYTEQTGDWLELSMFNGRAQVTVQALVAGYYRDGGYLSPLLVNRQWLSEWANRQASSIAIVCTEQARQQLQYWASEDPAVEILTAQSIALGASGLVRSLYSGGYTAVLLGAIFLALGFGLLALLIFLDSRAELAILKALGTRPREATLFFWCEFALSALLGLGLGRLVVNWLQPRLGALIVLNWSVWRSALTVVAGSYLWAMLAPARLAQRAQVNELLFRRPVLLFSQSITTLARNAPGLQDLLSHGWTCLRLELDGDSFPGVIVRPAGAPVKTGETLAWQSTWFGMGERRYLTPHDGVLQVADPQRGVLAISPRP